MTLTSVLAVVFPPLFALEAGRLFGRAARREQAGDMGLDWLAEVFGAGALFMLSMLIVTLSA